MKIEKVMCENCGEFFDKVSKEVRRSLKLERKQYCSRSCSAKSEKNLIHFSNVRTTETIHLNASNRRDEFTGFREHFRRVLKRFPETDIDLPYLKEVWDSQQGKCIYSKVDLIFVPKTGKSDPIYTISLDRIDSSIGYIKENVQFISIAMNHMKNAMSDEKVKELLTILKTV